jgi:hypothetical protein
MSRKLIFTETEMLFMIEAMNGVRCRPETFAANMWGHVQYASFQIEPNVLLGKLAEVDVNDLHNRLVAFWDVGSGYIPDTGARLKEVGLEPYIARSFGSSSGSDEHGLPHLDLD